MENISDQLYKLVSGSVLADIVEIKTFKWGWIKFPSDQLCEELGEGWKLFLRQHFKKFTENNFLLYINHSFNNAGILKYLCIKHHNIVLDYCAPILPAKPEVK